MRKEQPRGRKANERVAGNPTGEVNRRRNRSDPLVIATDSKGPESMNRNLAAAKSINSKIEVQLRIGENSSSFAFSRISEMKIGEAMLGGGGGGGPRRRHLYRH